GPGLPHQRLRLPVRHRRRLRRRRRADRPGRGAEPDRRHREHPAEQVEALGRRRLSRPPRAPPLQVPSPQVDDDRKGTTMSQFTAPSPTRRHLLRGALALPLGAAGLSLAACANNSDAAADPDAPLNVGQISNSIAFFPLHVAESKGFFEDEGVTLGERPRLGTGATLAAALTSAPIATGAG